MRTFTEGRRKWKMPWGGGEERLYRREGKSYTNVSRFTTLGEYKWTGLGSVKLASLPPPTIRWRTRCRILIFQTHLISHNVFMIKCGQVQRKRGGKGKLENPVRCGYTRWIYSSENSAALVFPSALRNCYMYDEIVYFLNVDEDWMVNVERFRQSYRKSKCEVEFRSVVLEAMYLSLVFKLWKWWEREREREREREEGKERARDDRSTKKI